MKTLSLIIAAAAALLALALPAAAPAYDPYDAYQWSYSQPSGSADVLWANSATTLRGTQPRWRPALRHEKRRWGIDLGWDSGHADATGRWQWAFVQRDDWPQVVDPGERVAIYNTKARAYLRYGERRYGINLEWSKTPRFEWDVHRRGARLALYNARVRDFLVYGERRYGVNLRWRRDLADVRDHRTR